MLTDTRIHKVVIEGGWEKSLTELHKKYLQDKSKVNYVSGYDYYEVGLDHEQMKDLVENKTDEEIFKLLNNIKWHSLELTVQDAELLELVVGGVKHKVEDTTTITVSVDTGADKSEMFFQKTMDIMERYQKQLERLSENTFNEKVKVHTGGLALAEYNQTMVKYDCCTDELQSTLAEGWRIMAVCVQPDQRRPDYVLGKVVKDCDVSTCAER